MRQVALLIVVSFLSACSHKYRTDTLYAPEVRLDRKAAVYVTIPGDGSYGAEKYPGSGRAVELAIAKAVSKRVQNVVLADDVEDQGAALAKAKAKGVRYIFNSQILHWEDRATEWSGKPDRITIKISVVDVISGELAASTVASASSKWGTFGGDHPEDLLPHTMEEFVGKLY